MHSGSRAPTSPASACICGQVLVSLAPHSSVGSWGRRWAEERMSELTFLHPPEKQPWAAVGNPRSRLAGPQLAEGLFTAGMTPGGLEGKVPLYFISQRTAGHERGTLHERSALWSCLQLLSPCGSWGCVLMNANLIEYSKRK